MWIMRKEKYMYIERKRDERRETRDERQRDETREAEE